MRRVGGLLVAVLCAWALGVVSAGAEVRPISEGGMSFGTITGPADPEEYSFSLELGEGQELMAVDDQHAEVRYGRSEHIAFRIAAEPASDAIGTNVPTTLTVTQPNIVTLTVHHREGNPAAGGAPFTYPVVRGAGWEGGFQTSTVLMPEDEAEQRAKERAARGATPPEPQPTSPEPQPQRVLVTRALGDPKLYFRPHSFLLSADGTFGIGKVRWKGYGDATATATGRGFANDCIPNCAEGRFSHPQAMLRLAKVVPCQGNPVYARLHYALTGPLPQGMPRQGSFSMLPLGEEGKPDC